MVPKFDSKILINLYKLYTAWVAFLPFKFAHGFGTAAATCRFRRFASFGCSALGFRPVQAVPAGRARCPAKPPCKSNKIFVRGSAQKGRFGGFCMSLGFSPRVGPTERIQSAGAGDCSWGSGTASRKKNLE